MPDFPVSTCKVSTVNSDLHVHACTYSLVVFSIALLWALIVNRVILVQCFDSCRVRNEERAGLEGASSYLCVKTWMSIEEELKTSLKYYIIISHSSFEWKALFKVPGLHGRVAITIASSKASCSWKSPVKIPGTNFWHYKLHAAPGKPINRF